MPVWPRHHLPELGGGDFDAYPNEMQLPMKITREISASQEFYDFFGQNADQIANSIEEAYRGPINHFVNANRQNFGAGSVQQHSRSMNLPGMTMTYTRNQGMEVLQMVVSPEAQGTPGGLNLDLNYDGYIAWVHYDVRFPDDTNNVPTFNKSYDLFLNGYLIVKDYQITQACQVFLVMFGSSALRCQSLVDPDNNSLNAQNPLEDGPVPNAVLPANKPIDDLSAPDGQDIPQHPDVFQYGVFDWNTVFNTGSVVLEGFVGSTPSYVRWNTVGVTPGTPVLVSGVQFKTAQGSPLNNKQGNSLNAVTAILTSGQPQGENKLVDTIIAEFYSRKTVKPVQQSWKYSPSAGTTIVANAAPRYWAWTLYAPGGSSTVSMQFDLFVDKPDPNNGAAPIAINSYPGNGGSTNQGMTTAMQNAIVAWTASVDEAYAHFAITQQPIIQAAITAVTAANTVVTADYVKSGQPIGGPPPTSWTYGTDQATVDADTSHVASDQADLTALQAQIPPAPPDQIAAAEALLALAQANLATAQALQATNRTKTLTDLETLEAAETRLTLAQTATPPLQQFPDDLGTAISKFAYRSVSVDSGTWSFGGYQGGGT